MGSSPRMRGTRAGWRCGMRRRGLIPTYAGNTPVIHHHVQLNGAHPHVCGEHAVPSSTRLVVLGSSPRMRGTPGWPFGRFGVSGLIPTYAGNTRAHNPHPLHGRAHPHVCGEHSSRASRMLPLPGSSPRMRGTHLDWFKNIIDVGLIPTYAGNTEVFEGFL